MMDEFDRLLETKAKEIHAEHFSRICARAAQVYERLGMTPPIEKQDWDDLGDDAKTNYLYEARIALIDQFATENWEDMKALVLGRATVVTP